MSKKINLYFFGETGIYDEYSPAYVCNKEFAPEILYIIAYNEPYSVSRSEIIKKLKVDEGVFDSIVSSLKLIKAIDIKDEKYKLNFTVFLERDMTLLDEYFLNIGRDVGKKIIEKSQLIYEKISKLTSYPYFNKERLLYHVICDRIFDGTAFDFFTEKSIFSPSKIQPDNRGYIIFGYEDSEKVENHSNAILCSSNNYGSENFVFNSFGNSEGIRKDMFRFFRKVQKILEAATPYKGLNLAYIKIVENINREVAEKCGELVWKSYKNEINYFQLSITEKNLIDFLNELDYLHVNEKNKTIQCNVPVFQNADYKIIDEVSEIILNDIFEMVKITFEKFQENATDLTAIKHKVHIKEIAIELWHQVFGFTNEYLIEKGFVQSPGYEKEEGRYLRSFVKM